MNKLKAGWVFGGALALAMFAAAPRSFAAPETQQVAIEKARFNAAQQLYDKNDFAGALAIFQDVVKLNNSPTARFYAARCLRELGRLPEAYEELTITMRDADVLAAKESRYAATRDAAATERAALTSKIALLTIAFADQPLGFVLNVGERVIDVTRLRDPVALMPGSVAIDASAPGREPFHKDLTIKAGGAETLAIVLSASGMGLKDSTSPAMQTSGGGMRKAGFVVLGVGILGGVTFAIAGIAANRQYNEVFQACGAVRCTDTKFNDEINTGKTLDTVANAGVVVAVAGLLGGAAMVFFGGPRPIPLSAGLTTNGAWIGYRSSF